MMRSPRPPRRRGAVLVEAAIVLPILLFLIIGLWVGALGIFRYQEVATLAREAARYAAVHGGQYAEETGNAAATEQTILDEAVKPRALLLDPDQLAVQVTWDQDNYPRHVIADNGEAQSHTVSVTVTYTWFPERYLFGPITLSSTAEMPMHY